jgi:NAD(P)-dependent dehydrogenase (short-subunit alcohol dehydrogenase family)
MSKQLEDRVALVTGGATGIGRATALAFQRTGARLVIADMNEAAGRETVELVAKAGGTAIFVHTDVTQASSIQTMLGKTIDTYGRLDCAFNNAGISGIGIGQPAVALTADYPDERWHEVLAINLTGVWLCMKYEIKQMLAQGHGAIVNTASIAGLVGLRSASAYVASKHGVIGITKTAALEYAQRGIRVNAVCPGYIETAMTAPGRNDPVRMAQMIAQEPVGRLGLPDEVAQAVVWLCSDAASFVTGHSMAIDGGLVAQ